LIPYDGLPVVALNMYVNLKWVTEHMAKHDHLYTILAENNER